MSYTSGIGGGQQIDNTVTPSKEQPVVSADTSEVVAKDGIRNATVGHVDEAALSSTGGLVFKSLEASDTRTAKVSSLQEAIAVGSYTVSSSDVANKIIQSLLE
jgi:negative regulator of flagellin synthesis FlgM